MQRIRLARVKGSRFISLGLTLLTIAALLFTACSAPAAPSPAAPAAPAAAGQPTAAPAAPAKPAATQQEVKLGLTWSLTGSTSDYGESTKFGAELAIKEYNASGGKYKINPVYYDDETKPEKGVQNTLRLINQDKVKAIVGPVNSGVGLAMVDIAQENKVLQVVPVATTPMIIAKYKDAPVQYTFRVSIPDDNQIELMLDWVQKRGFKKVGLMHDTTGWGTGGKDAALAAMQKRSAKPDVGPLTFAVGDLDMTPQLQQMKAGGVDAIIAFALGPEGAQILKSMEKMNWKVPMISTWAWAGASFRKMTANDRLLKETCTVLSFTPDASPEAKSFNDKIVKDYGSNQVPVASAQAYDATRLAIRALEVGGLDSADAQVKALEEQITDFQAVTAVAKKAFAKGKHESLSRENGYVACYDESGLVKRVP